MGKREDILKNRDTLLNAGWIKSRTDDAYIYLEDFVNIEKAHNITYLNLDDNDERIAKMD